MRKVRYKVQGGYESTTVWRFNLVLDRGRGRGRGRERERERGSS